MRDVVDMVAAFVFSGFLLFGIGYGIKKVHDFVKKEALTQVYKGLSSSEKMANALTGEKLGY